MAVPRKPIPSSTVYSQSTAAVEANAQAAFATSVLYKPLFKSLSTGGSIVTVFAWNGTPAICGSSSSRQAAMATFPVQAAAAVGIAAGAAGLIVIPSRKQKDEAAMDLFDKHFDKLHPQEQKVAEFKAAHSRWIGFFEKSVYPITRKLPGNKNPVMNPYKDAEPQGGQDDDE